METHGNAFFSATFTLILSILGSSVLPIPFAFAQMGVLLSFGVMFAVAAMNAVTSRLLLRAARATGKASYEAVAEAAGGRALKTVAQVSLVVLLLGTIIGDFALLADVGERALRRLLPSPPSLLVDYEGRGIMCLLVLCPVLPLCLLRRMRSLETAAKCGVVVLVVLASVIVGDAMRAGLPALRSGDFPLVSMQLGPALPEAFAVLGFSFYISPVLLPLLAEMPPGDEGVRVMTRASNLVILLVASTVYGVIGFFAAARWGAATQGDVLVNHWLGGWPLCEGLLNLAVAFYLAASIPPIQMSCRASVAHLLGWEGGASALSPGRHWGLTLGATGLALAVALGFPSAAEKIFAVTGASAVLFVCYLLPVIIHLQLLRQGQLPRPKRRSDEEASGAAEEPLLTDRPLENGLEGAQPHSPATPRSLWRTRNWPGEVLMPVVVALLGTLFSVAGLWVALQAILSV